MLSLTTTPTPSASASASASASIAPWLTTAIALGTFFVGVSTPLVVGGVSFGQQKNALESQTLRNQELQKRNDDLAALLEKWREAVAQRDALLSSTQSKLAAMQNDQCDRIQLKIDGLEESLSWAGANQMSEIRRAEINHLITQHQESLQSCFAARR
jgi:hypothetical protein